MCAIEAVERLIVIGGNPKTMMQSTRNIDGAEIVGIASRVRRQIQKTGIVRQSITIDGSLGDWKQGFDETGSAAWEAYR